ncbi:hypothetical protein LSCM1_00505 [Leishmania martiniquensis]|uniref:Rab-GAP TBC domain-containing protein n=1 Tax=Leishmania martiniquensis TaxID=1580590 RepID=A0A836GUF5_9TRYP|nr:hypothetical protein LSCM1_00505 [Leishmania martiniquensis]
MTVHVSSATIVTSLWGPADVTAIPLHPNGQFLSIQLSPTAAIEDNTVTSVAFHPVDETCFVLGTEAGKAYGVSLQENKLFLLADVGQRGALRCATFCPGYLTSPIVVFASSDNRLLFLDWQRGIVLQDVSASAHERPIQRLVTGASTESLFCAVSADAFSCWEPLSSSEGASGMDPSSSSVPVSSKQGSVGRIGAADSSPRDRTSPGFSMPRYGCSSSAMPTQCTLALQRDGEPVPKCAERAPHRFLGVHILYPGLLVSVETNGVLSLWSRAAALGDDEAVRHRAPLCLQQSATAPKVLRVRCSAQCGALIALGADAATVDETGGRVEPVVAFVVGQTLEGAGIVRLPTGGTGVPTRAGAVAVTHVSALQSDCVACLLNTGTVHVVLPSTFHLVFSIASPSIRGFGHCRGPRSNWSFTPSGPTFGAMWCKHVLLLLHLPTARSHDGGAVPTPQTAPLWAGSRGTRTAVGLGGKERMLVQTNVSRLSGRPKDGPSVVAQSFLRSCHGARSAPSPHGAAADSAQSRVSAALAVLSMCRHPVDVPKRGLPAVWPDVNEVDLRALKPELDAPRTSSAREEDPDATVSGPSTWSSAAVFCDTLTPASCQYNLNQLQTHLLRHGVFPHRYRPAIWRFLAGLPSKARTMSQFAALARRPPHLAVSQLMAPFPLPPSMTRDAVERALSCLCWASPVFTLASYLPVLVYPFAMVFHDDVQSIVEIVLVFFLNWGRDFFVCHPHGPTRVLLAMERQLRRLDEPLWQHLDAIGAGVAVWGWELLTSFFTDSLTGAEWVQVMDHTFTAAPLWLFAFHVTLVRTRFRPKLMSALSVEDVRSVLRRLPTADTAPSAPSSPYTMQHLIEEGYRLCCDWSCESGDPMTNLSMLRVFQTLTPEFVYPANVAHDSVVLAEKLRELSLLQRSRDEERKAKAHLNELRKVADAASAEEAAYLQQQRARVAAKYDACAASWQVHVAVEKLQQEREAEERQLRWDALQKRTRNAEELKALHNEMNLVESQLRHDMVDRHMEQLKWRLAAHLTDEELAQLQRDADAQVERAVQRLEEDEQRFVEDVALYEAAPPLCLEKGQIEEEKQQVGTTGSLAGGVEGLNPSLQASLTGDVTEERFEKREQQSLRQDGALSARKDHGEESSDGAVVVGSAMPSSQPPDARAISHESHLSASHSSASESKASSSVSLTAADEAVRGDGGPLQHRKQAAAASRTADSQAEASVEDACDPRTESEQHVTDLEKVKRGTLVDGKGGRRDFVPPPPRRHADCHSPYAHGSIAATQRRFLELRDRVLSRMEVYTQTGVTEDPLRRYRRSYRSEDSMALETASYPSSYIEPSNGRRLFDNDNPVGCGAHAFKRFGERQRSPRDPPRSDSYTGTETATTRRSTSSTRQSVSSTTSATSSYESPGTYTSYDYNYSAATSTTWRTGETRSSGSGVYESSSSLVHAARHSSGRLVQDDGRRHLWASRH